MFIINKFNINNSVIKVHFTDPFRDCQMLNDEFKRSFFLVTFFPLFYFRIKKDDFCTNFVIVLIRKDIEKKKIFGKRLVV
ncbi:hypothetical protein DXA15_01700 [Parabacteroides sp. AM58-2XD]|nr:hypothetical protein DXA15_01700 [Parabacteroides sp. AM58-2XD]